MEITKGDFEALKSQPFFKGKVVTDSMSPLIKVGDIILTKVGDRELKRFDIIVFYMNGKLVCHYLWSMNRIVHPILFQTRDLFYGGRDHPLSMDDYLGKVISHKLSLMDKFKIVVKELFSSK